MTQFNVPTRDEVSANNQAIFDNLQKGLGFVPNLYASFAHSETALGDYLALQNRKKQPSGQRAGGHQPRGEPGQRLPLLPKRPYGFGQDERLQR